MKLVAFLGLIGLSLIGSLILGKRDLNKHKKTVTAIVKAILLNVIILGLGSIWWYQTESDGISQGIGILIYISSMIAISLIDVIIFYIWTIIKRK
jgi:drug/metabolite transporter (DMT)-like permease